MQAAASSVGMDAEWKTKTREPGQLIGTQRIPHSGFLQQMRRGDIWRAWEIDMKTQVNAHIV